MKINRILGIAAMGLLISCGNDFEVTESGRQYRILSHDEDAKPIQKGDMLLVNLRLTTENSDSLILETYKDNSPRYIPGEEPVLGEVFAMLSKGDSVEVLVNADTLFQKSFGMAKPEELKSETNIRFIMTIVDVFDQEQLKKKSMEQLNQRIERDSLELDAYLKTLGNVQKTASGLRYQVTSPGAGASPKEGDKVEMRYKGYLLNGEVFDQNLDGGKPLEFEIGMHQVIPGWEEGVQLMKKGAKMKMIIPWQLAYGERGTGPIPPCASLVFEVELLTINGK